MKKSKLWQKLLINRELGQSNGFSLIEIMVVLGIASLILSMVALNVSKKYDEAKVSSTRMQIRQLGVVLDDFRRICGRYPTTEEGLQSLISAPASVNCKNFDPDGLIQGKKLPLDPWNEDYEYTSDGQKYFLRSNGAKNKLKKEVDSDHLD